ncbi:MAG: hypothetical protein M3R36_16070 [Bacteroidota bacterium]|nr:hypothetical protein [Bacteroidota bacterium]
MKNSNLILLISKLNAAEFKELGEYIRSSYFNKNEGIIKLYDYIKIRYPDFHEEELEKENVYRNLFPDIEYDDSFMRKLMFNLSRLAEDFLAYKNFTADEFNYSRSLLDKLIKRGVEKIYSKKLKSADENLNKQKIKDLAYYKNKFQIDSFNEIIMTQDKVMVNSKDKPEKYLINCTNSMINYFLVSILEEYRFLTTYKKIVRFDFDPEFYECILNYLKGKESFHNIPLISIYFYSVLLISEKAELYFTKLKDILLKELSSLNLSDRYSSFAILVNFANDEYQKGNKKYLKEAFELYKLIIENKLYNAMEGGVFDNPLFRNIVNVGLLMKEIEWTENFIKLYVNKLMPEARENALHLSNARVNFVKGNYEKSLEELSRIVSIHHFQVKPSIKSLTLMIYIEKDWINEAFDLIDAYKHYISYEKLLTDRSKEKNMNFIKFCTEILKLKSKNSKEKVNDIKYDLLNKEFILEKEWLEEKIEELEKNKH